MNEKNTETEYFSMPAGLKNRLLHLAEEDAQHRAEDDEALFFITGRQIVKTPRDIERNYAGKYCTSSGIKPINCDLERYPANGIRFSNNYEHAAGYLVTAGMLVGSLNTGTDGAKARIQSLIETEQIIEVGKLVVQGMYRYFNFTGRGIDEIFRVDSFAMARVIRKPDEGKGAQMPNDGPVFLTAKNFNMFLSASPREVGGSMIISGSFFEPSTVAEMVADGRLSVAGEWTDGTLELVPSVRDEMRNLALLEYDRKITARNEAK